MADIQFTDPPPRKGSRFPGGKHTKIAAALKERPGEWALVATGSASNLARYISGGASPAYRPADAFEATARRNGTKFDIYARYIGENGEHR